MVRLALHDLSPDSWFVAQLKPQGLSQAEKNLTRQGFTSFCPKRRESTFKQNKAVTVDKPLFPGYLFIQFDPVSIKWRVINATRGISRLLVASPHKPTPLPSPFMAGLMARCDRLGTIVTATDLSVGDPIRILSGPFAETVGRIECMTDDERVQILMDLMGQKTRVSVSKTRVEKL